MLALADGVSDAVKNHIARFEVFETAARSSGPRRKIAVRRDLGWQNRKIRTTVRFTIHERKPSLLRSRATLDQIRMPAAFKAAGWDQCLTLECHNYSAMLVDSGCSQMDDTAIRL